MAEMTQKEMFVRIAQECAHDEEIVAFCQHKLEQLSKPRKPRGTAPETVEFRKAVATALAEIGEPAPAKEIAARLGEEKSARTASALRYLVQEGIAVKVEGARKSDPAMYAID